MSLKAWWHQKSEFDYQVARANDLDKQLARMEQRYLLVESALVKERASKDKLTNKVLDQISRQSKLPATFEEKPKEEPTPRIYTPREQDEIQELAMLQRNADLAVKSADEVRPLSVYIEKVQELDDYRSLLLN